MLGNGGHSVVAAKEVVIESTVEGTVDGGGVDGISDEVVISDAVVVMSTGEVEASVTWVVGGEVVTKTVVVSSGNEKVDASEEEVEAISVVEGIVEAS
jgi:hypothetical protein